MKAFYFILISLFFTTALTAQYEKGSWYLSGSSSSLLNVPLEDDPVSDLDLQTLTGYFFTDRLLVGTQLETYAFAGEDLSVGVELSPFARYYFPGGEKRKVSYFGEAGFGTVSLFSSISYFETDFHLGGGAEISLFPGVVGTALLRYDANASGINITNLTFGLNLLLGQLEDFGDAAPLRGGNLTTSGSLGGLYFGREGLSDRGDSRGGFLLNPTIGYFLADGLMLEGQVALTYLGFRNFRSSGQVSEPWTENILSTDLALDLRYYLIKTGRVLPYVSGGVGYQTYRRKVKDNLFGDRKNGFDLFGYRAAAGLTWFLSPNVALDGAVRYQSERYEANSVNFVEDRNAVQLEVGVKFFLKR